MCNVEDSEHDNEMSEDQGGLYYADKSMVEHGCCWDTAIVRKCKPGEGIYGGDVYLVCECLDENAQQICDALNKVGAPLFSLKGKS